MNPRYLRSTLLLTTAVAVLGAAGFALRAEDKDKSKSADRPPLVLKSDGAANYTTTDLATLQYRMETWAPDEIMYVTDGRQQLHFRRAGQAEFRRTALTSISATRRSN
jgi:arginyl-tRNA synthetase